MIRATGSVRLTVGGKSQRQMNGKRQEPDLSRRVKKSQDVTDHTLAKLYPSYLMNTILCLVPYLFDS